MGINVSESLVELFHMHTEEEEEDVVNSRTLPWWHQGNRIQHLVQGLACTLLAYDIFSMILSVLGLNPVQELDLKAAIKTLPMFSEWILVLTLILCIIDFFMNTFLLLGATQGDLKTCQNWNIYAYLFLTLSLINFIRLLWFQGIKMTAGVLIQTIFNLAFVIFVTFIVRSLIQSIQNNPSKYQRFSVPI